MDDSVKAAFGKVVHVLRKTRKLSQDDVEGISRAHISDIERGATSASLETVFKIADVFKINPSELVSLTVEKFNGNDIPDELAPINFVQNEAPSADFIYDEEGNSLNSKDAVLAAINTNTTVRSFAVLFKQVSKINLFNVIDKKQTGSFLGAVFVSSLAEVASSYLAKNPSQTGHPDLVPRKYVESGKPFRWDQFPHGGVEIKTSCGTLRNTASRDLEIGKSRINNIGGIVWKGHHNEINHLLGLYWDYYFGLPTVLGGFYSNQLMPSDFTYTVPKEGGGHTTNVCITKSSGVQKMGKNWAFMVNQQPYLDVFKRFLNAPA